MELRPVFIWRVKMIMATAGLRTNMTFRSFRHGGFTVAGDADLSDTDVSAVGAKTDATSDINRKGTMKQRRRALTRLLEERSKPQRLSTCPG